MIFLHGKRREEKVKCHRKEYNVTKKGQTTHGTLYYYSIER